MNLSFLASFFTNKGKWLLLGLTTSCHTAIKTTEAQFSYLDVGTLCFLIHITVSKTFA